MELQVGMKVKHECGKIGTVELPGRGNGADFFTGHFLVMKDGKHYQYPNEDMDVIKILSEPEPTPYGDLIESLGMNIAKSFEFKEPEYLAFIESLMNNAPDKCVVKQAQIAISIARNAGYKLHEDYEVKG